MWPFTITHRAQDEGVQAVVLRIDGRFFAFAALENARRAAKSDGQPGIWRVKRSA